MIAEKIKMLRNANNMTQSELARKLNITRSSVNAWEMGISIPSTTFIVELAQLFRVSTDYLLGLPTHNSIDISTLNETEVAIIYSLIRYFNQSKKSWKDNSAVNAPLFALAADNPYLFSSFAPFIQPDTVLRFLFIENHYL